MATATAARALLLPRARVYRPCRSVLVWCCWCVLVVGGAEEEEREDGDGRDEAKETGENAKVAKSVEAWLPFLLGGVLMLAVVGWCAVNVYRASKEPAILEDDQSKSNSKQQNHRSAMVMTVAQRQKQIAFNPKNTLQRSGTGDVSPNYDLDDVDMEAGRVAESGLPAAASVASAATATATRRPIDRNGDIAGRVVTGLGGSATGLSRDLRVFEGDELQGKKAPGETGDVYRNPLSSHAGVVLPRLGSMRGRSAGTALSRASGSDSTKAKPATGLKSKLSATNNNNRGQHRPYRGSGLHQQQKQRKDRSGRGRHHGPVDAQEEEEEDRDESPPHLRPGVAQSRRPIPRGYSREQQRASALRRSGSSLQDIGPDIGAITSGAGGKMRDNSSTSNGNSGRQSALPVVEERSGRHHSRGSSRGAGRGRKGGGVWPTDPV